MFGSLGSYRDINFGGKNMIGLAGATLASGLIGAASSIGSGIFNWWNSKKTQEETWEREDTAVQRRAKDLEAAGLSKTLAAGSAATTNVTSAPSYQGNGVQDALNAAAQYVGIKNAQQENANMKKSFQVMNSEIDKNYGDMFRSYAEQNYFNAMANKALIDGQTASYLGLKYLQDIEESKGKVGLMKHQEGYYDSSNELNFWNALRAAQEFNLVGSTGYNSSVSGRGIVGLQKIGSLFGQMLDRFTGADTPTHHVHDYRTNLTDRSLYK